MNIKIFILCSFKLILETQSVQHDFSDEDFNRMPELFVIDDYNNCMRRSDGIFCSLRLELYSEPSNKLYQQIQEHSADHLHHFNHSVLDRAVCVATTCKEYFDRTKHKEEDLPSVLEECFNKTISKEYELYANVIKIHYCQSSSEKKESNTFDLVAIATLIAILMMNLVGSLFHIYLAKRASENKYTKILLSFSIFRNIEYLCKTSKNRSLKGLNGLRMLAILQIIFVHCIFCVVSFGDNVLYYEKILKSFYFQPILFGLGFIQICFGLSGFLLAYKISEFEDTAQMSWRDIPKILLNRIFRLSPSYAVVLLVFISLVQDLGSGALWTLYVGGAVRDCRRFFWHHMFYINNYIAEDVQCSVPTWYTAADFQLFVLGSLVLCLTKQRRMLVLSVLLLLSLVGPLIEVWFKGLEPVPVCSPKMIQEMINDEFIYLHIPGHNNMTCFIGAMIAGLMVFRWRIQEIKIKNQLLIHLSNLTPMAILGVFLFLGLFYTDGSQPTLGWKLVLAAGFRIVLCAVIACLLISLTMEFKSPFCQLLSWSGWEMPSKLAYSMYLIHQFIIYTLIGLRNSKENISILNLIVTFLGVTSLSIILAVILYVLVEAPFCNLLGRQQKNIVKNQ